MFWYWSLCCNRLKHMWQSRVEIESYSVAYFGRIAVFEALYHWISVKGGAHMCFVDLLDVHASTKCIWAPPLTEVQRYGASNTVMQYTTVWFLHGTATYILARIAKPIHYHLHTYVIVIAQYQGFMAVNRLYLIPGCQCCNCCISYLICHLLLLLLTHLYMCKCLQQLQHNFFTHSNCTIVWQCSVLHTKSTWRGNYEPWIPL